MLQIILGYSNITTTHMCNNTSKDDLLIALFRRSSNITTANMCNNKSTYDLLIALLVQVISGFRNITTANMCKNTLNYLLIALLAQLFRAPAISPLHICAIIQQKMIYLLHC